MTYSSNFKHTKYRADIDGLRAIAVLGVVIFHAFPNWVQGGFIGVDVFFVISGYLISTILFENLEGGTFSFSEFYSRRIKRIFPALILILLFCLVIGWLILLADEYRQLGKHVLSGAAFISNLTLWKEVGYFDNSAETKPLLHLWSLGIEEQFYIIWPALLWLAWKRKFNLLTLTFILCLISFLLNLRGVGSDILATFYLPQTRFWELLSGSLLAWLVLYKKNTFAVIIDRIECALSEWKINRYLNINALISIVSILGFFILIYGFININKKVSFPGFWAIIPVLGTVLIIAVGPNGVINRTILSNKIAVWFGLISFPLYLWHWPLLSFLRIIEGENPSIWIRVLAVLLSITLAWVTYKLIEYPIRIGKFKASRIILPLLILLMSFIGLTGYIVYIKDGFIHRKAAQIEDVYEYGLHWNGWSQCDQVKSDASGLGGCFILSPNKPIDVLLIGDSHAGHLATGLRDVFLGNTENIAVMLYAGCYPSYPVKTPSAVYFNCPGQFISRALDYAIKTPSVKTVVLSGYPALHIQQSRFHESSVLTDDQIIKNLDAFDEGTRQTLKALINANKKVIYILDVPELLKDPKSCTQRIYARGCEINIPKEAYLNRNKDFLRLIDTYRKEFPSVIFVNSSEYFCDDEQCYGNKDGTLLYATRDHLTPNGSRYLVNSFRHLFNGKN